MSRPALAATRSLEVIELFTSFPDRTFSFSEVIKATKINTASCHAILNVLTAKGYLLRSDVNKSYQLGPSLIAAGRVAEQTLPIVGRAEQAAQQLFDELGLPVLLCTMVGGEILAILSLQDKAGRDAGMRGGERLPVIPPLGVPFLAWGPEEDVEKWIESRSPPLSAESQGHLRRDLELSRKHGYHVHMRASQLRGIGTLIAEMSRSNSINDYKEKVSRAVYSFDDLLHQQDSFDPAELYQPQLISAPIFDQNGRAVLNLGIGGFHEAVTGDVLINYAERLTKACLDVMRGDRAQFTGRAIG